MSRTFARHLSTTTARASHIGSSAIPIPANVSLRLPPLSISPTLPSSSAAAQRSVHVTGPLGSHTVPIQSPIIIQSDAAALQVSVHNAEDKAQRSLWGLTRTMINNAIVGVSTGYTVDIKLVGVGYRAAIEPIPDVFLKLQKQMHPGQDKLPTLRINLKLGYAHPVLIDIPHDITVTTPAPTNIVLSGTDKQQLGLFAARIRRWRKPEPYRGKASCTEIALTAGYFRQWRDHQAQRDKEKVVMHRTAAPNSAKRQTRTACQWRHSSARPATMATPLRLQ